MKERGEHRSGKAAAFALAISLAGSLPVSSPFAAQTAGQVATLTVDAEGLMACAVIYGDAAARLATTAQEQASLSGAAGAYAAAALHLIGAAVPDVVAAEAEAELLQTRILAALNAQGGGSLSAQDALIAQWLPWCDAVGPEVSALMRSRAQRGW